MLPAIIGISRGILSANEGLSLLKKAKSFTGNDNYGRRHENDNDNSSPYTNDNEKEYRRSDNDNEKDARRHDNDNDKGYKSPVKSIPNLSLSYSYSIPSVSGNIETPALSKKEESNNTDKLLDTVITLLYSIQSKLQDQNRLETYRANLDAVSKRETELEKIKKELNQEKENKVNPSKKVMNTSAIGSLLGIAGLGALLGIGGLETKTLDKIGQNISEFQNKYAWLIEVGQGIAAGSLVGSIVPGVGTFGGAIVGGILATINHYFPLLSTVKKTPYPELEGYGKDNKWYSSLFDIRTVTPEQKSRNDKKLAEYQKESMKGFVPSSGILGSLGFGTRNEAKSNGSRQDKAYEFFKKKGWTDEQSAGIVGNLLQENSTLDPNKTNSIGAHGIAQWLSSDRKENFKNTIGRGTKTIEQSTFDEQLEFIDWELRNSESKAGNALKNTSSIEDATMVVRNQYERPGELEAMDNKRLSFAQSVYKGEQATNSSDNIEAGEYTEENKPETNNFTSIIDSLKSLPNTDTNFVGSIEEITKRNMINNIKNSSMKEEDRLNFGDLFSPDIASNDNTPQSNIKKINGGTLDVINPNYNLPEYSILNSYLNFFGMSDIPMNRSVMI